MLYGTLLNNMFKYLGFLLWTTKLKYILFTKSTSRISYCFFYLNSNFNSKIMNSRLIFKLFFLIALNFLVVTIFTDVYQCQEKQNTNWVLRYSWSTKVQNVEIFLQIHPSIPLILLHITCEHYVLIKLTYFTWKSRILC